MPTLAFAQVNADTFEERVAEGGVDIYVRNDEYSAVTFRFKLNLKNVLASSDERLIVVPARTERFLVYELRLDPKAREFSYGYEYVSNVGDHTSTAQDDYVYELPVAAGTEVFISQGYNGKFSHQGAKALDFDMPEGTPIHAIRGGVVTDVVEVNDRGCADKSCEKFENRIVIVHDDGTFAGYAHLRKNGAFVSIGERVKKGQLLGESGATGYANGPHLHLSVYHQRMDGRKYVATRFKTAGAQVPGLLKEHRSYRRPLD